MVTNAPDLIFLDEQNFTAFSAHNKLFVLNSLAYALYLAESQFNERLLLGQIGKTEVESARLSQNQNTIRNIVWYFHIDTTGQF